MSALSLRKYYSTSFAKEKRKKGTHNILLDLKISTPSLLIISCHQSLLYKSKGRPQKRSVIQLFWGEKISQM